MFLRDSNSSFGFRQKYVYIAHLPCHILFTVVPFGKALSKKIVTDQRDYTRGPLDTRG